MHQYIEVFNKLHVQLSISDLEHILIIKFNSGLLSQLCNEVALVHSTSLSLAFQNALAAEKKLGKHPFDFCSQSQLSPDLVIALIALLSPPHTGQYYSFPKMTSHNTADCCALHHTRFATTLFFELAASTTPHKDVINVENPIEPDSQLILMNHPLTPSACATIFTHNCQIKISVVQQIVDNDNQKNLVSATLVKALALLITNPPPYCLG